MRALRLADKTTAQLRVDKFNVDLGYPREEHDYKGTGRVPTRVITTSHTAVIESATDFIIPLDAESEAKCDANDFPVTVAKIDPKQLPSAVAAEAVAEELP